MNIFVTGCAGFIGSSLVEKLLSDDTNTVIGIDNFDPYYPKSVKEKNLKDFINHKNFIFYENDIRNNNILDEIFNTYKIDVVVHIAAKAGVRNSFSYPCEYISVNVDGTAQILNTMLKYGVKKIVFASSSSVYGNNDSDIFNEDIKNLKPLSVYALSKKMGEDLIKFYSEQFSISAICLRFFTVFGPKQRPDLAIHKFCTNIKNEVPITLFGDGSTLRDYTYIDDITDGIIASVKYNKSHFEIINLGSQRPISLSSLVEYIEQEIGKKAKIEYAPMQHGDVIKTYADISKAKKLLNYEPKLTFQQGLHKFVKYLFEQ